MPRVMNVGTPKPQNFCILSPLHIRVTHQSRTCFLRPSVLTAIWSSIPVSPLYSAENPRNGNLWELENWSAKHCAVELNRCAAAFHSLSLRSVASRGSARRADASDERLFGVDPEFIGSKRDFTPSQGSLSGRWVACDATGGDDADRALTRRAHASAKDRVTGQCLPTISQPRKSGRGIFQETALQIKSSDLNTGVRSFCAQ